MAGGVFFCLGFKSLASPDCYLFLDERTSRSLGPLDGWLPKGGVFRIMKRDNIFGCLRFR